MRALAPLAALAAASVLVLAGCTSQPTTVSSSPAPTRVSPTVFTMPKACAAILPLSRISQFTSENWILLGGPGGLYGDSYLGEPTPEQDAGGITCIWGSPKTEISSVTVSVAPVTPASKPTIAASLLTQGLGKLDQPDSVFYAQTGDDSGSAAILNVLTDASWISVIETVGGVTAFNDAAVIAGEVHDRVYS